MLGCIQALRLTYLCLSLSQGVAVSQMWEEDGTAKVTQTDDVPEDLQVGSMWTAFGADPKDMAKY